MFKLFISGYFNFFFFGQHLYFYFVILKYLLSVKYFYFFFQFYPVNIHVYRYFWVCGMCMYNYCILRGIGCIPGKHHHRYFPDRSGMSATKPPWLYVGEMRDMKGDEFEMAIRFHMGTVGICIYSADEKGEEK